jgi:hypothetical protein
MYLLQLFCELLHLPHILPLCGQQFVILIMAPLAQILVTSTLARSNTLWLSTSASRSSSDAAARGARFTEA